eukprot:c15001_g1_i2.p1 GENE.c15001_g1_i2~~c15001_g1_i2.p1  ORF type:complete len:371 (+),score=74.70 c15001_g1_i2:1-1113(+)
MGIVRSRESRAHVTCEEGMAETHASPNRGVFAGLSLGQIALIVLAVQNASQLLLMNYSRRPPVGEDAPPLYLMSTAVVCVEAVKLVASFGLLWAEHGYNFEKAKSELLALLASPMDTLKVGVPAVIYVVQNNLLFVATSNLDAATTQLTYQLKILTTALLSFLMLGKVLSQMQWGSLVVLTIGVGMVQLGIMGTAASSSAATEGSQVIGLTAVVMACVLSGFAAVYFERILKGSPVSIWIRNIQLGAIGSVVAIIGAYTKDGETIAQNGFFGGYNMVVVLLIGIFAVGGLVVAVVVRYADNVIKNFATSFSVVICATFSCLFLGLEPSVLFVGGSALVLLATFMYSEIKLSVLCPALFAEKPAGPPAVAV